MRAAPSLKNEILVSESGMIRLARYKNTTKPYRVQIEVTKGMWQTVAEHKSNDLPGAESRFHYEVSRN